MGMASFEVHRPSSLKEACELGRTFGAEGRFLAGGTDLLVDLQQKRTTASHVIALDNILDLKKIREEKGCLRIGALVTMAEIGKSDSIKKVFPQLSQAARAMGSTQIRNQATMAGNFCSAVPCADTPPICLAGKAQLRIVGLDSEKTIEAEDFFVSARKNSLKPGELLAEILIPVQPPHSGTSYQRFSLRSGTAISVAAVAVRMVLEKNNIKDARIVLGAVAPVPLMAKKASQLLIQGGKPSEKLFGDAARSAASEAQPISDLRGSEAFRRDLIATMTVRALNEATERAKGGIQ